MSKKILIAEDEKPMAKALQLKLNSSGFDAETAADGEQAIALLSSNNFDLLLLDLVMPKKDGFAVLKEIKDQGIKTKVIITSNLSQEEDRTRTIKLGAQDYIVKSNTSISEIVDRVKKILN